jgi:hypothetical protein
MWQDVWEVFTRYITGEPNSSGVRIKQTPWCDEQLNTETSLITDNLAKGKMPHLTQKNLPLLKSPFCIFPNKLRLEIVNAKLDFKILLQIPSYIMHS